MKVSQSCPTLCDPMNYIPPGSSVHAILRQEYWSGLPFPSPGDLLYPGIEPGSPSLQADPLLSEPSGKPPGNIRELMFNSQSTTYEFIVKSFPSKL